MGGLGGRDDASGWLGIQEWESRVRDGDDPFFGEVDVNFGGTR